MEKSVTFALTELQQIISYRNYEGFGLCTGGGKDPERYHELENAIRAYVKKSSPEDGSILVHRSTCLDPQKGWYRADRGSRYAKGVYLLKPDQLPYLKDPVSNGNTSTDWYVISSGKVSMVSREQLLRPWFDALPSEVKQKWLEEILFREVVKDSIRFL